MLFESRGHKAHWIKSGSAEAKALSGEKSVLKAKVNLLDTDLKGIDGYSILRKMVRDGLRSRVIMMSMHSRDDQVMAALEAGSLRPHLEAIQRSYPHAPHQAGAGKLARKECSLRERAGTFLRIVSRQQ